MLRNATDDADTITCESIGGLITEAEDNIKDAADSAVRDITLIAAAQQVEHHEIAVYGTLRAWANLLGLSNDVQTIESILNEEKAADKLLSKISGGVNMQAAA
jgi:ferritin-like metal-binding protein YciE